MKLMSTENHSNTKPTKNAIRKRILKEQRTQSTLSHQLLLSTNQDT
jgi:hypothetical protein